MLYIVLAGEMILSYLHDELKVIGPGNPWSALVASPLSAIGLYVLSGLIALSTLAYVVLYHGKRATSFRHANSFFSATALAFALLIAGHLILNFPSAELMWDAIIRLFCLCAICVLGMSEVVRLVSINSRLEAALKGK